jgi:hypothetical protein
MRKHVIVAALLTGASALAVANDHPPFRRHNQATQSPQHLRSNPHRRLVAQHLSSGVEVAANSRSAQAEAKHLANRSTAGRFTPDAVSVAGTNWVSLGPTDAINEYNGSQIAGVDSGRPNSILVDPRDGNVVYMAVSGGGVWKSLDFLSAAGPTWAPLTDTLPNLAIGAALLDPANPDTLYIASGDAFDTGGNTVQKSLDGGVTWSDPVTLAGTYPAPNGFTAAVGDIRTLGVRGSLILAGTNVGLFKSTDGGATFALVDLPNANSKILTESIWTVVDVGGGHWLASGYAGCDETTGPPPLAAGEDPVADCPQGNNALIWSSSDGATWTPVTLPAATGTGRLTLATGATTDPTKTVVYAFVGAVDGFSTLGFWRSNDGGVTWADATGALANPTFQYPTGPGTYDSDCLSIDVGHEQSWYNQAITVDPSNPDHVLVGGNLCGMRTLNGTAAAPKWELVSHWLPSGGGGTTSNGVLPYVHADWHAAAVTVTNGVTRVFAGTDGGLFSSTDVFSPTTQAEQVTWANHNKGLATHLMYSVASGDPVNANPFVLFAGLQDNGTRYRSQPATPSSFNQPVGGDGIGATVHVSSSGTSYWASVEFGRYYCQPSANIDCSAGFNWNALKALPGENTGGGDDDQRPSRESYKNDTEPFLIRYANVETDTVGQSVLTDSTGQVFVNVAQSDGSFLWVAISQDLTGTGNGFANVAASRSIPGLYGAVGTVSRAPFYYTTTGNVIPTATPTPWTVTQPVFATGTTARLTGPSSMDFPPITPTGTQPGQVFIGSFTGIMNDGSAVPDDKGRLWRTADFGKTWTSIVGADPMHRLPNVQVWVVKYDPVTPTTIYAGTDVGMYISTDNGANWDRYGQGFPVVPVRDIYVAKNQEFIRVATYGRGLWELYPSATANHGAPGNGDYDRNLQIDWADLAAMSARLGTTPATTTAPLYSWIEDLTGVGSTPVQAIDDGDLSALLAKFGATP